MVSVFWFFVEALSFFFASFDLALSMVSSYFFLKFDHETSANHEKSGRMMYRVGNEVSLLTISSS